MPFEFDFNQLWATVSGGVLNFLAGLLILLLAYLVARILSGAVRNLLGRTDIDNRFARAINGDSALPIESWIARAIFWIIMLIGVVLFLDRLQLTAATGPLNSVLNDVFAFLLRLGGALIILAVAWAIATVVRMLVVRGAEALRLDERLNRLDAEGAPATPIGQSLGTAAYWLIFLLALPLVLEALGLQSLVVPLQGMLDQAFEFLPRLLAAGLILLVGLFVARIVRRIVSSVLVAFGVDRFGAGLNISISALVGTLAYTVIMLLVIVQSLDALQIAAISEPATSMVGLIFDAVPRVIGAILLLVISYIVARLVAELLVNLLVAAGIDTLPQRLGLNLNWERKPSEFVRWLVIAGTLLLAAVPAAELLGFAALTDIVQTFLTFGGQVVLGIIVLAIGLWLANLARDLMDDAGMSAFSAALVRGAILVLVGGMALQAIGIGENIVQLAFGIGLGAIGVAAALAFGLGSREIAGREVERFVTTLRTEDLLDAPNQRADES